MTIDTALRTYLKSFPALYAKVGEKIFPAIAADATVAPYMTFNEIGVNQGGGNEVENYEKYYQFSIYAKTYTAMREIVEIMETIFFNRPGPAVYAGIKIVGGTLNGSRDMPLDLTSGNYSAALDVKIKYYKI